MDKVYFLKNFSKLDQATEKLLKDFYPKNSEIMIKIHFGEPGNKAAFTPEDIEPVISSLTSLTSPKSLILTDTPVMYPSLRNSVRGYQAVAKQKGFEKLAKIKISNDGAKVKTKDFTAEVCRELAEAENVLVLTHVKGHDFTGLGGALKNLGMGGVTQKTKKIEHTLGKPILVKECKGCGTCMKLCPAKGIKIVRKLSGLLGRKTKISLLTCGGCSICQLNCPHHCLKPKKALFDDLLAQAAAAVIKKLPKRTFYISYLKNITHHCDCARNAGEIICKDLGVLFSTNPVAIDQAAVELINKTADKNLLKEIYHKDPLLHINFAAKYAQKETNYQLIEI